jgi:hypothetical protein
MGLELHENGVDGVSQVERTEARESRREAAVTAMCRSVLVVAVLGLVLATSGVAVAKSAPSPILLTDAQVQAALLSPDEMPKGWTQDPTPTQPASPTGGLCNGPNRIALIQQFGGSYVGVATYGKDFVVGPAIAENLIGFPTVAAAKDYMKAIPEAIAGCSATWDEADPATAGRVLHSTATPFTFKKQGDQVYAHRLTTEEETNGQPGRTWINDRVLVRSGNHVVNVNHFGTAADRAALRTSFQTAYDKFTAVLRKARQEATKNTSP